MDERFDGFPLSDNHFRVFSPDEEGKRIEVYDVKGDWDPEKQKWTLKWDEKPREVIRPGFKAPFWWDKEKEDWRVEQGWPQRDFYAFRNGETYFFVTDEGKLFKAEKGKDKERKLAPLKQPEGEGIRTVLFTDSDADKTFVLRFDEKNKVIHFAQLQDETRFQEIRFKDLKSVKSSEPMRTARQALQVLSDAGLVSLEKKK